MDTFAHAHQLLNFEKGAPSQQARRTHRSPRLQTAHHLQALYGISIFKTNNHLVADLPIIVGLSQSGLRVQKDHIHS